MFDDSGIFRDDLTSRTNKGNHRIVPKKADSCVTSCLHESTKVFSSFNVYGKFMRRKWHWRLFLFPHRFSSCLLLRSKMVFFLTLQTDLFRSKKLDWGSTFSFVLMSRISSDGGWRMTKFKLVFDLKRSYETIKELFWNIFWNISNQISVLKSLFSRSFNSIARTKVDKMKMISLIRVYFGWIEVA